MTIGDLNVKVNIDREGFAALDLRPFWAGFVVAALATLLTHLSIIPKSFFKPLIPQKVEIKKTDFKKEVKPLLEKKANGFKLNYAFAAEIDNDEINELSSYAVVDLGTGEILAAKNSSLEKPIASITKVMTAVVVLDLAKPADLMAISKGAAASEPTKIGVVPGEKMTVEELLKATLLTSANDAAKVIEEGIDAKYEKGVFIRAMNEKAKFLGLKNSRFDNPQGFDSENNYSSAEDLAVLTQYALANYPLISEIVKKDYEFLAANANHKQFDLYNWNGLIGVYPGAMGVKIGNTDDAGRTTVVVSKRQGKQIAAVVLGAKGVLERDLLAARLLDAGFEKALGLKAVVVNEEQLKIKYSSWKYFN